MLLLFYFLMKGFKQSVTNPQPTTTKNILLFAVFKNYQNRKELIDYIKSNPNISFEDFKVEADRINTLYNSGYLKTEFDFIKYQGEQYKTWNKFIKDGVTQLEYVSKKDDKVRYEHELLDGTIKPIDDVFWQNNYPPIVGGKIAWNCRCKAVPVNDGKVKNKVITNAGISGKVIPEDLHPYFDVDDSTKKKLTSIAEKILNKVNA